MPLPRRVRRKQIQEHAKASRGLTFLSCRPSGPGTLKTRQSDRPIATTRRRAPRLCSSSICDDRSGDPMRKSCLRWFGALSAVVLGSGCGTTASPTSLGSAPDGPGLRGELRAMIATYEDGSTEIMFRLRTPSGESVELVFDAPPAVDPGAAVIVQGTRDGPRKFHVSSIEVVPTSVETE